MSHINTSSDNIKIFPVANRPKKDPAGRLTTEYNLTSLINKLLDVEGFVVTDTDNSVETGAFDFNLHGYFIHIEHIETLISGVNSDKGNGDYYNYIYAVLGISSIESSNQRVDSISGIDYIPDDAENYVYTGVHFIGTDSADPNDLESTINDIFNNNVSITKYILKILKKNSDDNKYTIPIESKTKFGAKSITIDDGVI